MAKTYSFRIQPATLLLLLFIVLFNRCNKDKDPSANQRMLLVKNGAAKIGVEQTVTYEAVWVNLSGETTTATDVQWSVSNTQLASISETGVVTPKNAGIVTVIAAAEGYTAKAPLAITTPTPFTVAPSALIGNKNMTPIQIETFYVGATSAQFQYTSSNADVAAVSASGLITYRSAGECIIEVKAANLPGTPVYTIPVIVAPTPEIELPVVRLEITPGVKKIYRNQNIQYIAKAYDSQGQEAAANIGWVVVNNTFDKHTGQLIEVAAITGSGLLTAKHTGTAYVRAIARGIVAQAEVIVAPDLAIAIEPSSTSISSGGSTQFLYKVYQASRTTGVYSITTIPSTITWAAPATGLPIFDIATVNAVGMVTIKSDAQPGVNTFLQAYVSNDPDIQPGVSVITVR